MNVVNSGLNAVSSALDTSAKLTTAAGDIGKAAGTVTTAGAEFTKTGAAAAGTLTTAGAEFTKTGAAAAGTLTTAGANAASNLTTIGSDSAGIITSGATKLSSNFIDGINSGLTGFRALAAAAAQQVETRLNNSQRRADEAAKLQAKLDSQTMSNKEIIETQKALNELTFKQKLLDGQVEIFRFISKYPSAALNIIKAFNNSGKEMWGTFPLKYYPKIESDYQLIDEFNNFLVKYNQPKLDGIHEDFKHLQELARLIFAGEIIIKNGKMVYKQDGGKRKTQKHTKKYKKSKSRKQYNKSKSNKQQNKSRKSKK